MYIYMYIYIYLIFCDRVWCMTMSKRTCRMYVYIWIGFVLRDPVPMKYTSLHVRWSLFKWVWTQCACGKLQEKKKIYVA